VDEAEQVSRISQIAMRVRIFTAFFPVRVAADDAFVRLAAMGIARDEMSLIPKQVDHPSGVGIAVATKAAEGAAIGMFAGGILCGAIGAIAAGGAIMIPGLGSVIVGPIVAGLAAAGAGGALGGVLGAVLGVRIPEYEATYLDDAVGIGGVLVAVRCQMARAQQVEHVLQASGGLRIRRWATRQ
jgi:hypothetical protein